MIALQKDIEDLKRMLESLLMIGTIAELDEEKARVRVDCGALQTNWLPWLTRRAGNDRDWWAPEQGEQVMVLSPGGDPEQGVVLPAIYRSAHPAPADSKNVYRKAFSDGTVIEYDRAAHLLKADVKGSVQLLAEGTLDANISGNTTLTTPTATINGHLVVNGNINGSQNITAAQNVADQGGSKTMSGMRSVFDDHDHEENGEGGGTTDQPNQSM